MDFLQHPLRCVGSPGAVSPYHAQSAAIAVAGTKCMVAASVATPGRVICAGHDSFFAQVENLVDTLRWVSRGTNAFVSVGLNAEERSNVERAVPGATWLYAKESGNYRDLLFVMQQFPSTPLLFRPRSDNHSYIAHEDSADILLARAWLERGGSGVFAITPWGWSSVTNEPLTNLALNRLLVPAGLAFIMYTDAAQECRRPPSNEAVAAFNVFLTLRGIGSGGGGSSSPISPTALQIMRFSLPDLPIQRDLYNSQSRCTMPIVRLCHEILGRAPPLTFPVEFTQRQSAKSDGVKMLQLAHWDFVLRELPMRDGFRSPFAFPGPLALPSLSPPASMAFDRRQETSGLYAAPGRIVWVSLAEAPSNGCTIKLTIGCHTDDLSRANRLSRIPRICCSKEWVPGPQQISREAEISFPMSSSRKGTVETAICSAFGGLIYVETDKPCRLSFSGGFALAPNFSVENEPGFVAKYADLNPVTNRAKNYHYSWAEQMAASTVPWGELEGELVVLVLPLHCLRKVADPAAVVAFWDSVVATELRLSDQRLERKERIVVDIQISAGYMHSGHPIMCHMDVAEGERPEIIDVARLKRDGSWGFYHELGHNRQRQEWNPSGATEITVNIFSMGVFHALHGFRPMSAPWIRENKIREKMLAYLRSADKDWEKSGWTDNYLGLSVYALWLQIFGFDAMRRVFRYYAILQGESPRPKSDLPSFLRDLLSSEQAELRSLKDAANPVKEFWWVVVTSAAVERSLINYYSLFGWPIDWERCQKFLAHLEDFNVTIEDIAQISSQ